MCTVMGCPATMAWNGSLELGAEVGIRVLLFIIFVWTEFLEPFHRKIQPEEMWLYKNPTSTEDRVPTLYMFAIAYLVPVFTVLFIYFIRYGKPDLKPAFLAMSLGMVINGVLTNCIKLMVGSGEPCSVD
uniref:phospholipid phosphatase 4-like n=1 Tax=Myxine glutinosa TaxID=7769 RepID=UPI00358E849A